MRRGEPAAMSLTPIANGEFTSIQDLCLKYPMYHGVEWTITHLTRECASVLAAKAHMDCFCLECEAQSVFHCDEHSYSHPSDFCPVTPKIWRCTRNMNHKIHYFFEVHKFSIRKIGQAPALVDIALGEFAKYRKALKQDYYREFTKAIGLASHGVGIGSFVYLRRVFESLI